MLNASLPVCDLTIHLIYDDERLSWQDSKVIWLSAVFIHWEVVYE